MAFRAKINKTHEDQAQVNQGILNKIDFRNKTERSLLDLPDTCDTLTLDAFTQNKKNDRNRRRIQKRNG